MALNPGMFAFYPSGCPAGLEAFICWSSGCPDPVDAPGHAATVVDGAQHAASQSQQGSAALGSKPVPPTCLRRLVENWQGLLPVPPKEHPWASQRQDRMKQQDAAG